MVDPNIKKKADDIRTKIKGKEVRESLASGLEAMSTDVVETVGRQTNVESQFQDVIENTTDKDVISAPEIIAARNGEENLKARLDNEHADVTAQLAQTGDDLAQYVSELDNFTISPEKFEGTDFEKVQQAIDEAIATDKGINLSRMYDITGAGTLMIDKPTRRRVTRFVGVGGIIKTDEGFIFDAPRRNTSDVFFRDVQFRSSTGKATKVINGTNIIRVNFSGAAFYSVDTIMKADEFIQSARFVECHVTGGSGSCFESVGYYDFHFNNNLVEHRENFFTQYIDMTKTHRMLYNVVFHSNVIEGLTGYTFQLGETQSLVIDSNYFEKNAGGYLNWLSESDYVTGVRIVGNRMHDDVDTHPFVRTPWRVFTFSSQDNAIRNNPMYDNTNMERGYIYSTNDHIFETQPNIDPKHFVLQSYYRQTPRKYEELSANITTHSHYTRMVKRVNQTVQANETINLELEFPMSVNIDDMISVQIVSETVEVINYYRQHSNPRILNLRLRNNADTYSNTSIFVTVLKQDMLSGIS